LPNSNTILSASESSSPSAFVREAHLTGHPALPQPLGHEPILEITEPGTLLEVVPRQEHVPQTQLLRPLFQVVDDGWMAFPSLLAFAELGVVDCVRGYAFLLDEVFDL
jgi:hypothetical protein